MVYSAVMRNTTVIEENVAETDEFVEAKMLAQPLMEEAESVIEGIKNNKSPSSYTHTE
jgi:hypothetical protein